MSRKNKTSSKPLKNIRVLVGRARHQASALSSKLRALGATVLEIPFIEIRKPKSFKPLDEALKKLNTYDWLILTSVNGVEAMWERMTKLRLSGHHDERQGQDRPDEARRGHEREGHDFSRAVKVEGNAALAAGDEGPRPRIAAIGPATRKVIEDRGLKVDVVPEEYIAESVVKSLQKKVKGKRVLLVRAKVARDVIPRELRKAGAHVDVVEAYETVVPQDSRKRLRAALAKSSTRPHVITFTSSSTVKNFVALLGSARAKLAGIRTASIGPVTSSTLRELGMPVHIEAKEYTIPGLVKGIVVDVDKT
jgi:uroporphyrinogen-III synthase